MWHSPQGDRTFTGPYSLVLAHGLDCMIEHLLYCFGSHDEDHDFGYESYAALTLEQKAWTVHKVAFSLLDPHTPPEPLHAHVEATAAMVFEGVLTLVEGEIVFLRQPGKRCDDGIAAETAVCRAVLAAHEIAGHTDSSFCMGGVPLTIRCVDMDRWRDSVAGMESVILPERHYDRDDYVDMPPEQSEEIKNRLGISEDYFWAIPDDPSPEEAIRLLKDAEQLCRRVIRHESPKPQ